MILRRWKPAKPSREQFRKDANERAARAALVPYTGNVQAAPAQPPIKGKA